MSLKLRLGKMSIGSDSVAVPINLVDEKCVNINTASTATSGTNYAQYAKLTAFGIGVEAIAGRNRTILRAAAANAHGSHDSLEMSTAGSVSGLGTAIRGNIVMPNVAIANGTYYGIMAEIYTGGNTSALPAASNAALCINVVAGTAMDLVANAIAFNGTSGDGKMIHAAAPQTLEGSIRVLINGVQKYIPYYTTQHV